MTIKLVYVINHSDSIHCGLCLGLDSLRVPRPKDRRYVSVFSDDPCHKILTKTIGAVGFER